MLKFMTPRDSFELNIMHCKERAPISHRPLCSVGGERNDDCMQRCLVEESKVNTGTGEGGV